MPSFIDRGAPLRYFELSLGEVTLTFTAADQALIARHFVEHDREGFARAWLRAQELSWAADLLKD